MMIHWILRDIPISMESPLNMIKYGSWIGTEMLWHRSQVASSEGEAGEA